MLIHFFLIYEIIVLNYHSFFFFFSKEHTVCVRKSYFYPITVFHTTDIGQCFINKISKNKSYHIVYNYTI